MRRIRELERRARRLGGGTGPLSRLTDAELMASLERLRRGEPDGVDWTRGTPDPRFASMSDEELKRQLETVAVRMRAPGSRRKQD